MEAFFFAGMEGFDLPQDAKQELLYKAVYRRDAEAVRVLVELGADPWGKDPIGGEREAPVYMSTKERCAGGWAGDVTFHEQVLAAMGYKPCRCEGCDDCDNGRNQGICLRSRDQACVVPLGIDQEAEDRFPDYGWRSEDDGEDTGEDAGDDAGDEDVEG